MGTSSHFSALSSWVLPIAKAIDSYACDSRALFTSAGLDYAKPGDPVADSRFPLARAVTFGHMGDGDIRFDFSYSMGEDKAAFMDNRDRISDIVHTIAVDMGGLDPV